MQKGPDPKQPEAWEACLALGIPQQAIQSPNICFSGSSQEPSTVPRLSYQQGP